MSVCRSPLFGWFFRELLFTVMNDTNIWVTLRILGVKKKVVSHILMQSMPTNSMASSKLNVHVTSLTVWKGWIILSGLVIHCPIALLYPSCHSVKQLRIFLFLSGRMLFHYECFSSFPLSTLSWFPDSSLLHVYIPARCLLGIRGRGTLLCKMQLKLATPLIWLNTENSKF